jgi:hypothetical protein
MANAVWGAQNMLPQPGPGISTNPYAYPVMHANSSGLYSHLSTTSFPSNYWNPNVMAAMGYGVNSSWNGQLVYTPPAAQNAADDKKEQPKFKQIDDDFNNGKAQYTHNYRFSQKKAEKDNYGYSTNFQP